MGDQVLPEFSAVLTSTDDPEVEEET